MNTERLERVKERLSKHQGRIFETSKRLIAYGVLLARQGADREGFTELEGLGSELEELGYRLERVAHGLDLASISLGKLKNTSDS